MSPEPLIAVLGANGFIGNRIVERLHLGGAAVRPIVRRASGLVLASRFAIEGRIADGFDVAALTEAFRGCDVVIHALAGDDRTIVGTIAPVYAAAERAGCRRIVYLSSAMVHGQSPAADADERSPLSQRQPISYNLAKIKAEERLFALRRKGSVEAVVLRPGIVYGPRSQWIGGLADDLLASRAYLVDGGAGLCNAIHVDNLVHAILLACRVDAADGQAFFLGESGATSWRDFYGRVAAALGRTPTEIPSLPFAQPSPSMKERIDRVRRSHPVQATLQSLPRPVRAALAAFWGASGAKPDAPMDTGPRPTLEMALLHNSRHVPSWEKARELLGYEPPVAMEQGWRDTIAWLAFAGYPVTDRFSAPSRPPS